METHEYFIQFVKHNVFSGEVKPTGSTAGPYHCYAADEPSAIVTIQECTGHYFERCNDDGSWWEPVVEAVR